jgi:hypothetical protein
MTQVARHWRPFIYSLAPTDLESLTTTVIKGMTGNGAQSASLRTVGAVYDRALCLASTKYARS